MVSVQKYTYYMCVSCCVLYCRQRDNMLRSVNMDRSFVGVTGFVGLPVCISLMIFMGSPSESGFLGVDMLWWWGMNSEIASNACVINHILVQAVCAFKWENCLSRWSFLGGTLRFWDSLCNRFCAVFQLHLKFSLSLSLSLFKSLYFY